MATSLNNLAVLYRETNRLEQAKTALDEAIAIWERFYETNPGGFRARLETSLLLRLQTERDSGSDPKVICTTAGRLQEVTSKESLLGLVKKLLGVCGSALQETPGGGSDGFVARLDLGESLELATYLGGEGRDSAEGVALSPTGTAWISGLTDSKNMTFPMALQPNYGGGKFDGFLVGLRAQ